MNISRRGFLKLAGTGTGVALAPNGVVALLKDSGTEQVLTEEAPAVQSNNNRLMTLEEITREAMRSLNEKMTL